MELDLSAVNIAEDVVEHLMGKFQEGVKLAEVGRMAPKTTKEECSHTVQSFVYQCFTEKYQTIDIGRADRDPSPPAKDSIATNTIETQHNNRHKGSKELNSFFGDKSRSIISDITKKSKMSNFISGKSSKLNTQKSATKEKKESVFISIANEQDEEKQDPDIARARKIQNDRAIDEVKSKKWAMEKAEKERQSILASQKFFKDKNKSGSFTFDYEGSFYGVNPSKIQPDNIRKMRQNFGKLQVFSKERQQIQTSTIDNEKMSLRQNKSVLSKEKVQFSEKAFSIAEALGDNSKISEGVKITQLRNKGDAVTLEKKAKKLQGIRNYRLKDYKELTKEKSFKEFSLTTPKKSKGSVFELSQSPAERNEQDLKSKTARVQRNQPKSRGVSQYQKKAAETHAVLQNALGRGLPFIRTKGLRFYDVGGTTNTFRTLEPGSTSRRKFKSFSSRIKIDDSSLYEQTFLK